jgi:hypothetical protein
LIFKHTFIIVIFFTGLSNSEEQLLADLLYFAAIKFSIYHLYFRNIRHHLEICEVKTIYFVYILDALIIANV